MYFIILSSLHSRKILIKFKVYLNNNKLKKSHAAYICYETLYITKKKVWYSDYFGYVENLTY